MEEVIGSIRSGPFFGFEYLKNDLNSLQVQGHNVRHGLERFKNVDYRACCPSLPGILVLFPRCDKLKIVSMGRNDISLRSAFLAEDRLSPKCP